MRSRASDALARIGGARVVDAVLELVKDKDENIRRAAIEILNTCRDKRAVDQLIEATKDADWWVSERAADALAEIGDAKALPALLEMMARNNRSLPSRSAAVGKLGTDKILDKILPYLQRPEKEVRIAAIGAVAQLAGEQQAEVVRPYIQQSAAGADETVERAASKALQKLDGRLIAERPLQRRRARAARARRARPLDAASRAPAAPTPAPTAATRMRRAAAAHQRRRRPATRARCSSTDPRRGRGPAAGRSAVVRPERSAERRHDRRPLQIHPENRQGRVRHGGARRGHGRRRASDPEVPERERRIRRGDAEALRARAALLAADHAQERHPHLRFPVHRRRLRDFDGVLSVAHARRRNREREADAAGESRRLTRRTSASA